MTASVLPDWANPALILTFYRRSLRRWHPGRRRGELRRFQSMAASAFYQAGVHCHKSRLLQEILLSFEAGKSSGDPDSAALSLLPHSDFAGRAALYYDIALTLAPHFAEAHYNKASLHRTAGQTHQAMRSYKSALAFAPHARAKAHAFLHANAAWEAAVTALKLSRRRSAGAFFAKAVSALDNFGVDHRQLPLYFDRSDRLADAMAEFERVISYSHRYAPEFIEPDFDHGELLPTGHDDQPLDPLRPTVVAATDGASAVYFLHLYFRVLRSADRSPAEAVIAAIRRGRISHARSRLLDSSNQPIDACSPRLADLGKLVAETPASRPADIGETGSSA